MACLTLPSVVLVLQGTPTVWTAYDEREMAKLVPVLAHPRMPSMDGKVRLTDPPTLTD